MDNNIVILDDKKTKTDLIDNNIVVLDGGLRGVVEIILEGVSNSVKELNHKERRDFSHADRNVENV